MPDWPMHSGMMWGMGAFWLLVLVLIVLGIAALLKYLFGKSGLAIGSTASGARQAHTSS